MTREEAIKILKAIRVYECYPKSASEETKEAIDMAIEALADRPTGEWEIKTETDEYGLKRPKLVCSKCEKEPAAWDLTELFEFCPNCGARMIREDGEEE